MYKIAKPKDNMIYKLTRGTLRWQIWFMTTLQMCSVTEHLTSFCKNINNILVIWRHWHMGGIWKFMLVENYLINKWASYYWTFTVCTEHPRWCGGSSNQVTSFLCYSHGISCHQITTIFCRKKSAFF